MDDITEDLTLGFDYVGPQHPGPGWAPRLDETYSHPIRLDTFKQLNEQYIHQKLVRGFVDPRWEEMLRELASEKTLGRVQGPFSAPSTWPKQTVALPDISCYHHRPVKYFPQCASQWFKATKFDVAKI